jgi:hypothetical protein
MPTYIPNITDKQQSDIEAAANDSAIRIMWFDGKEQQTGATKFVRAYDLNAQGNTGAQTASAMRQFSGSGLCVGSHNDKPARFETPGKA